MLAHSLSGMKPLQMSFEDWRKVLGTALKDLTQFFNPTPSRPKRQNCYLRTVRSGHPSQQI
jgi:hypothetical protein